MCNSYEWAILLMRIRKHQLLVASYYVAHVPKAGEGGKEWSGDMADWGEVTSPDKCDAA